MKKITLSGVWLTSGLPEATIEVVIHGGRLYRRLRNPDGRREMQLHANELTELYTRATFQLPPDEEKRLRDTLAEAVRAGPGGQS